MSWKADGKPVVGFAAASGTGKTTLLRGLIPALAARGVRVAVIKHSHHDFDVDKPGKDSYELRKAGAAQTLVMSRQRTAVIIENPDGFEPTLTSALDRLDPRSVDVVLVEGFKWERFPKVLVHRGTGALPQTREDAVAVATDRPGAVEVDVPVLDLNRPDDIAAFIVETFLATREDDTP